jgi:RimJ/RimL family protein N-acetyltransferase
MTEQPKRIFADKRDVFMRGENIVLKVLTETDVRESGWYGWFNDKETTAFMQQRYFPNSLDKQLEFYKSSILGSSQKIQLGILPYETPHIIGVVSLSGIDFVNRKAEFGIVIGERDVRGKGYGTEACAMIVKHGFERLSLNKITLGVLAEHTAAIRSYEKVGFRIEGTLREDVLLNGAYHNTVQMSILASEFRAKEISSTILP